MAAGQALPAEVPAEPLVQLAVGGVAVRPRGGDVLADMPLLGPFPQKLVPVSEVNCRNAVDRFEIQNAHGAFAIRHDVPPASIFFSITYFQPEG